jgi:hypothetical protein
MGSMVEHCGCPMQRHDDAGKTVRRHRHRAFTRTAEHRAAFIQAKGFFTMSSSWLAAFGRELREQRWDDHRYYHQSRINQALHLVSASFFIVSYIVLFFDPALAALLAWGISMTTRQAGHFFFEPKGFDHINRATHEHKEAIKVGYNLQRKVVLMGLWAAGPLLLWLSPSLGGLIEPAHGLFGYAHDVGMYWLALGVAGVLFRMAQLTHQQSLRTAVVWVSKIITDPFHDITLYWKAPYHLLRGQWLVQPEELAHRH